MDERDFLLTIRINSIVENIDGMIKNIMREPSYTEDFMGVWKDLENIKEKLGVMVNNMPVDYRDE